jgi:two-component system, cell cycle response regulator
MLKVLLVENNLIDAKQVLVMLARQGGDEIHATHVERLSTALRYLSRESFDVIMMNSTLVDTHGMDALNLVQAALARLPIVMLSDKSDESVEHAMIQSGVQEVLVKSQWTGDQLARAIRHAVERKRAEQHLSYMAQYDPLTALANRTLFQDRATQAISRAKRKKQEVGIILLGLDRFKEINTELGRDQGDALLKATADRLQKCMREVDTVARLGGVEFTVLLEGITSQANVEIVANRIIAAFGKPFDLGGQEVALTASLGISLYPLDHQEHDGLLERAQDAMAQAKEQGGNTYRLYASIKPV